MPFTPSKTALPLWLALVLVAATAPAAAEGRRPPEETPSASHRRPLARPPVTLRASESGARRQERREGAPSFPEVAITFLLTSDLNGRFARVRCSRDEDGFDLSTMVAAVDAERERLRGLGQPAPVVVDAGDLFGTAPITRYLLARGESGAETLASLVGRMGYDLDVLGNEELALPLDRLSTLLRVAGSRLRMSAANVACDTAVSTLCDGLNRGGVAERGYVLLTRGGLRVALVPVTRDDTPRHVDARNVRGLTFEDPLSRARAAVQRARRDDRADLVVVVGHVNDAASVPRRALQLARRVTGADLVFSNGLAGKEGGYGVSEIRFDASPRGERPPIFGQGGPESPPMRVTAEVVYRHGRPTVRRIVATPLALGGRSTEVSEVLSSVRQGYCREWDVPLSGAEIDGTMEPEDFVTYVLQIMRFETRTELAVINRGAVVLPAWPPLSGTISRDLLFHALPYRSRLVRFSLKGSELRKWLDVVYPSATRLVPSALRFSGISIDGSTYEVNERPLNDQHSYSLVTTQFLALGGDDFLVSLPKDVTFEPVGPEEAPATDTSLLELAERWFAERRYERLTGAKTVSLATNFPSLFDRLLWGLSSDVTLLYNQTLVGNDPGYSSQSQLNRDELFGLEANAKLRVDATSRLHDFTNLLDVSYAQAKVGDAGTFNESKDLTVFESAYGWLYLRNELGGEAPWVPVPLGKLRLEAELTQGEDAPFHHLELTGVVGPKWLLSEKVSATLGYGLGTELLDPNRRLDHGLDLTFEIQRLALFDLLETPFTLSTRLDLFYTDIGGADVVRGILENEVSFGVAGPLALTIGFDAFFFRSGAQGVAFSTDLLVGLKVLLEGHVQEL